MRTYFLYPRVNYCVDEVNCVAIGMELERKRSSTLVYSSVHLTVILYTSKIEHTRCDMDSTDTFVLYVYLPFPEGKRIHMCFSCRYILRLFAFLLLSPFTMWASLLSLLIHVHATCLFFSAFKGIMVGMCTKKSKLNIHVPHLLDKGSL